MAAQRVTIEVDVIKVGTGYIAATLLGGINVRGKRADSARLAVANLFYALQSDSNDDASIALDLALEGVTLGEALAIESGDGDGTGK